MNTKVIYASLAAFVVSFLLGWLVFGMLMKGYYEANMATYAGLLKPEPKMLGIVLFNLGWGGMMGWALNKMGVTSAAGGVMCGAIIALFFSGIYDVYTLSFMNVFMNKTVVIVDVLVSTAFGGLLGGVAGLVLGMGKPAV